jgi:hypothetical protein
MKHKKFLLFLFLVAFIIRAFFLNFFLGENRKYFTFDSAIHHDVACNIMHGNGILRADGTPNFWRVPGYAFFLSVCYKLFGGNEVYAMWLHLFLSSFLPLLAFFLSLSLFPAKILLAKVASMYSAIHLGYVLFSGLMMTESLFCLFFFFFLILFLQKKYLFVSGICLGIATLIRPIGHYVLVLLAIMIFLERVTVGEKLKHIGKIFLGWFIVVFSWLLRNFLLTGYLFFHTLPGNHFLYYVAVPIDMSIHGCSSKKSSERVFGKLSELIQKKEKKERRLLMEIERCMLAEKLAQSYMLKRPFLTIKNAIYNMIKTCVSFHSSHILAISDYFPQWCYEKGMTWWNMLKKYLIPPIDNIYLKIIIWLEVFFSFFIMLGFLLGLYNACVNRILFFTMLRVLPVMVLMIFLTFASGISRLRLPIEVFLIIFSINFWLSKYEA